MGHLVSFVPRRARRAITAAGTFAAGTAAVAVVLLAVTAPAGLAATGAAAAPAATAATTHSYSLTSGHVTFTGDGHTWTLGFGWNGSTSGTGQLVLTISTPRLSGLEYHAWTTDQVPAKDLSVSSTGKATLDTGSALSPVLALDLTFTPAKHTKETCLSGSGTDYSGALSGTVSLTTGLKAIKVSKKFTFASPNTLDVSDACVVTPCELGNWSTGVVTPPGTLTTQAIGDASGTPGHLSWLASVARAGVKTASTLLTRTDGGELTVPAPTGMLDVTTSSSGVVTGTATFTSIESTVVKVSCLLDGKKYTDDIDDNVGSYTSSSALTAHTLLTGNISAATSGYGLFTIDTLAKA